MAVAQDRQPGLPDLRIQAVVVVVVLVAVDLDTPGDQESWSSRIQVHSALLAEL